MTTLVLAATLFSYTLGGVWEIGAFTDLRSCEQWRAYQITQGAGDVTPCKPVESFTILTRPHPTYGAPLTVEEYTRRSTK